MASSGSARNTPPPNSPSAAPVNFKANQQRRPETVSHKAVFFLGQNFMRVGCCLQELELIIWSHFEAHF